MKLNPVTDGGLLHFMTVGEFKKLLNDPKIEDDMLIAGTWTGDMTLWIGDNNCVCFNCIIASIDLGDEEISWRE